MSNPIYPPVYPPFGGGGSTSNLNPIAPIQIASNNISIPKANGSTDGYLSHQDWTTFSNAAGGGISSLSIDVTTGTVVGGNAPAKVVGINNVLLSGLGTGILKNTTITGAPSIAIASDFPVLNQNTTGSAASFTGVLVGDVTGNQGSTLIGNNVVSYAKFQQVSANSLLGNPTGSLANVEEITLGTSLIFATGTLNAVQDLRNSATPAFAGVSLSSTFTFATGAQIGYLLRSTNTNGDGAWINPATILVTEIIQASANQVIANNSVGNVTLSLPQNIDTAANVQFGTGAFGSTLVSNSILSLTSTTKTFVPPRMTTVQRNLITAATGSMIFNTDTGDMEFYTGSAWIGTTGSGVFSGQGTAGQVLVNNTSGSAQTGALIFTLPQSIATSSAVQFGTLGLGAGIVASSILSLTSTSLGFLPPRVTTTQKNAISSPATGLVVYDTTLNDLQFYNGTSWVGATLSGVTTVSGLANQILVNSTTSPQSGAVAFSLPNGISLGSFQTIASPTGGLILPGRFGAGISAPLTVAHFFDASTLASNEVGSILLTGTATTGPGTPKLLFGLNYSASVMNYAYIQAVETGIATRQLVLQPEGNNGTFLCGNSGFGSNVSSIFSATQRVQIVGSLLQQNDGSAAYDALFRNNALTSGLQIQSGGVYAQSTSSNSTLTLGSWASSAVLPVLFLDNNGFMITSHVAATVGTQLQNSYPFFFQGGYWNGSSDAGFSYNIRTVIDSTAPSGHLSFQNSNGVEFLQMSMPTNGIASFTKLVGYGVNTNIPFHLIKGARGTAGSPSAIVSGDYYGGYAFSGYQSGTGTFVGSSGVLAKAIENFTSTAAGTQIEILSTVANGATTLPTTILVVNPAYVKVLGAQIQGAQGTAITSGAFIQAYNGNSFTVSGTSSIQCCDGNNADATTIPDDTRLTFRFLSAACSIIQGGTVISTGLVFNMIGGATYISTANGMITFRKQTISGTSKWMEQYRGAY